MKTVRVVHVVHSFGTGGLEKGVATIVRHASPDVSHTLVCLDRSGESETLLPTGTPVLEMHKQPGNSPAFLWRLSRTLARLAPDVVHTRNWGGLDAVVAARLGGLRGVVHGEHGWTMDDPEGVNARRIRVRRWVLRGAAELTCVSKAIEVWLRETVRVRTPTTQIYNGVDLHRYTIGDPSRRAEVRSRLAIDPDAFVVTTCSRLDPIKDHPTLFRAFHELRRRRGEAVLLVIGDGPERARLERELPDGAHLLGARNDVDAILAASDVFALPSLNEGISNTVLEAMAAGLPVIATRVGGNPEVVVDGCTGHLVEIGDAPGLAGRLIDYALDAQGRRDHGHAGRSRVEQEFSIERMVRAYESVYRRLAAVRHSPVEASSR